MDSIEYNKKFRVSSSTISSKSSSSIPIDDSIHYNHTRSSSQSDSQCLNIFGKRRSIYYDDNCQSSEKISDHLSLEEFNNSKSGYNEEGIYVEAIIPNVRKFLNLITSLYIENSNKRYSQTNRINDCPIYFKFDQKNIKIHHISESKSLYTCLILEVDELLSYNIYRKNDDLINSLEFTIDFHAIILSLVTFNPNSSFKLCFDSNYGLLVLEEIFPKRFNLKTNNQQCITCKIKTMQNNSFDIPIDIVKITQDSRSNSDYGNDTISIYSNYLYSCLYDITSDFSNGKLVLAIFPEDDSLNSVLVMAKSQPTISTQWNFRMDCEIFEKFKITSKHEYYYSIRSWAQITKGIKNSKLVNILVQSNGILLLEIEGHNITNNEVKLGKSAHKIYYYLYPIT